MFVLLIDYRPEYLSSADDATSLLTLPFGVRSFVAQVFARAVDWIQGDLLVMPTFRYGAGYEARLASHSQPSLQVVSDSQLSHILAGAESSDQLLVVDSARWPADGFELLGSMLQYADYRGATHLIAVGADGDRTREYLECDDSGQVQRVQRFYDGVNWPAAAVTGGFASILPAWAVASASFNSLAELRTQLSASGVLSRDIPKASDLFDLTAEAGALELNEQLVAEAIRSEEIEPGFLRTDGEVLVGRGCTVHPSARLVGPLILHEQVTVDEEVTVIGPTVIGAGSHLQRGATIAQAVLAGGTTIDQRDPIRHCIATGQGRHPSRQGAGDGRIAAFPTVRPHDDGAIVACGEATPTRRALFHACKRVIDVTLVSLGLVVLTPLLFVVAVLMKLDSPGPVFFAHRREGRGGKEFGCLKFRTMVVDAHRKQKELYDQNEVDGPQFKMADDPRLTRMGRLLRATNIDELPQLFNVLVGHMSLVGPRPSPFRENQVCVPWRRARLSVRPGITGLWQLCRDDRADGDFHQWIYYDIAYVRNMSVWLDVKILLATVLTGGGRLHVPVSCFVHANEESIDPVVGSPEAYAEPSS